MDAPCKIQGSIHVFRLVNNMCPGKWVHIIVSALYSLVGALLNKVATEIFLTCSNIDIYLPSMLKSAVK